MDPLRLGRSIECLPRLSLLALVGTSSQKSLVIAAAPKVACSEVNRPAVLHVLALSISPPSVNVFTFHCPHLQGVYKLDCTVTTNNQPCADLLNS